MIKISSLIGSLLLLNSLLMSTLYAQQYTGDLSNFSTQGDGTNYIGSVPLAIVVTTQVRDAMQGSYFGMGSTCIGSDLPSCAPSISSAELISMIGRSLTDMNQWKAKQNAPDDHNCSVTVGSNVTIDDGTLYEWSRCQITNTSSGIRTKNRRFQTIFPPESIPALEEFASAGSCGQIAGNPAAIVASYNGPTAISDATSATILSGMATHTNRNILTVVPVTEINNLDSSNNIAIVKLNGYLPDISTYKSGNYVLGQNIYGIGVLPEPEASVFTGISPIGAIDANMSPPAHRTFGGTPFNCAPLTTPIQTCVN